MTVSMVERDLTGVTMEQLGAAQKAAIDRAVWPVLLRALTSARAASKA